MWHQERYQRICTLLDTFQRLSTERLASELGVSRETVRRDLLYLERRGELRRIHGGAMTTRPQEPPIDVRAKTRIEEKRTIAKLTRNEISSGQTLFIDAGTTTTLLAEELSTLEGLVVVTNSIAVALKLSPAPREAHTTSSNRVILLGGDVNSALQATFGAKTIGEIHRYRADLALLSPVGIDAAHGATSYDHDEAEIAAAMAACASRIALLADHSKIGRASRLSYCRASRIDLLVSDRPIDDPALLDALAERGRILHPGS